MAFVIAVDGPAASGKGTVSSMLAEVYGLPMLDTGMLYRAVGAQLLAAGKDPADAGAAEAVALTLDLDGIDLEAIRSGAVGEAASQAAAHPGVRRALLELQRAFAAQPGGAVLDGRDIGTVICPTAAAKLFITASPEARAHRRWLQLSGRGEAVSEAEVLADIRRRDDRDSHRSAAPLLKADDAVLLDTTAMSISQTADVARRIVEEARARWDQRS